MTGQHGSRRSKTLLVVDDDVRVRDMAMYAVRDMRLLVRYVRSREDALEAAARNPPAVVLTSIEIDGTLAGPGLARILHRRHGSATIFTAGRLSDQHVDAVAAVPGSVLLCKPIRVEQLQSVLRVLLRRIRLGNEQLVPQDPRSAELATAIRRIAALVNGTGLLSIDRQASGLAEGVLADLRPREQEIVRLLFNHGRVPGVAQQLGISPQTVRNHLKRVFQRLGVHSQQELLQRVRRSAPDADTAPASFAALPASWDGGPGLAASS